MPRTRIGSYDGSVSEWFGMNVEVHNGSVLSPLLFIIVMEAVTHSVREGLPWEMLYADDLVLVGKCEEELKEKLRKWNECLKDKGLKINEEKTKVMCESFGTDTTQVVGNVKHPCSICLKGDDDDDDVVLCHTLPVFTGLGQCPIVNWDFSRAVSIFWTRCPSCCPPMTFTRIRTHDLSNESHSS